MKLTSTQRLPTLVPKTGFGLGWNLVLPLVIGVLCNLAAGASGQDFNIDFGTSKGTPSNTYGAAAAQVGTWTSISTAGNAVALDNLGGTLTSTTLTLNAQYTTGSIGAGHTGDQQALLDDNFYSGYPSLWSLTIAGLVNGNYTLYYYAPANAAVDTGGFAANGVAASSITGSTTGFTQGVDWQVLPGVVVSNGTLTLTNTVNPGDAGLAGLQVVVPEPSSRALLLLGGVCGIGLALRIRQRPRVG